MEINKIENRKTIEKISDAVSLQLPQKLPGCDLKPALIERGQGKTIKRGRLVDGKFNEQENYLRGLFWAAVK